jgi:hypothetical protein
MLRPISFILAVGFLAGCRTRQQEQPAIQLQSREQVRHSFSIGMTRGQVHADLTDSWLVVSASRPDTGWSREVSPPAGSFAGWYESSHPNSNVESCDVFWIGHTNAPAVYFGIRLRYFYFDREQKLIAHEGWVIN